jgi:hypothetical protein
VIKYFQDSCNRSFLHVRVEIQKKLSQSGQDAVDVIRRPERAEVSQSEASNLGGCVFTVFFKGVDGHD